MRNNVSWKLKIRERDLSNPDDGCMRRYDSEGDTPLQIRMRELYSKVIKQNLVVFAHIT
jgi:hypothetical protein